MKQLIMLLVSINLVHSETSPCPDIFQYRTNGGENYGIITIPPPGKGVTILNVTIVIHGTYHGKPELHLAKSAQETVEDAKNGLNVQYKYKFPQSEQLPSVSKILLNNRKICNGPEVNVHTWFRSSHILYDPTGAIELSHINYCRLFEKKSSVTIQVPPPAKIHKSATSPPRFALPPAKIRKSATISPRFALPPAKIRKSATSPPRSALSSNYSSIPAPGICGKVANNAVLQTLIIGGEDVAPGEFPWMVAMYKSGFASENYICGGNLISAKYVITAAHCTKNQQILYLEIGRYDISDPNEKGYVRRISLRIIAHQRYKTAPEDDIALILIERIYFAIAPTQNIRPLCLWQSATPVLEGTISGWGMLENGNKDLKAKNPMKINVKIASPNSCRDAHPHFKNLNTNKAFCAGGESKGPCKGDSGSGLYVKKNNIWYLRGIISVSIGEAEACNLNIYSVFTDLAYYRSWIEQYI